MHVFAYKPIAHYRYPLHFHQTTCANYQPLLPTHCCHCAHLHPASTTTNHHQLPPTITNYHQPPPTTTNYHKPPHSHYPSCTTATQVYHPPSQFLDHVPLVIDPRPAIAPSRAATALIHHVATTHRDHVLASTTLGGISRHVSPDQSTAGGGCGSSDEHDGDSVNSFGESGAGGI